MCSSLHIQKFTFAYLTIIITCIWQSFKHDKISLAFHSFDPPAINGDVEGENAVVVKDNRSRIHKKRDNKEKIEENNTHRREEKKENKTKYK